MARRTLVPLAGLLVGLALGAVKPTLATYSATVSNSATANTQAVFPPLNVTPPQIVGTLGGLPVTSLTAGQSLTATTGTWTTSHPVTTTYAYQWQRCVTGTCSDIAGATAATYTVQAADVGNKLRVKVTGTDSDATVTPHKSTITPSAQVP